MKRNFVALAVLFLTAFRARAEVPSAVAIKGARVVTVSGPELSKGTVLLRGGLIEDVGADLAIPSDAWVIEGAGLTVYPGFIDGLSTWGIPGAVQTPGGGRPAGATGATPVTSQATQPASATPRAHGPEDRPLTYAFERAADQVNPADTRLPAAMAAGFTSAATFPNRGIFEGLGALVNLAGQRGRDMVVAEPIGEQIVFRTGGGGRSFPSSLMGNIAYIRQLYLDLDQNKQAKQAYAAHEVGERRPEYDHNLEGLAEAPRVLLPAVEEQQIDRMLSFGAELKTPFVVYGLHEASKRIDELKRANVPLLVSLKWPEKPKDADPADIPNYRTLALRERAPSVPGLLAKAGVKFGFYSDGVSGAPELRRAVKKAIDAGLSRAEAVRALTLDVAEMYGVADRMGSIEKGKIANVVVMKGDAFEEQSTVEYVFIDGKQFQPSKDLQKSPPGSDRPRRQTPEDGDVNGGENN